MMKIHSLVVAKTITAIAPSPLHGPFMGFASSSSSFLLFLCLSSLMSTLLLCKVVHSCSAVLNSLRDLSDDLLAC